MRNVIWALIVVIALLSTAGASDDPFIGKWILDPQHSSYPAGNPPKRMVIEMEPATRGIRYHSDTTYANGHTTHTEYTADYDGRQVLVWGTYGLMLPVSLKRIDSHTVIASYFKSFQVVATSRRVVSRDGRRMTITTTSKDRSGRKVTTIGIYGRKMRRAQRASIAEYFFTHSEWHLPHGRLISSHGVETLNSRPVLTR
ncbi:MAG TPA: hypothetical protein VMS18_30695 [Candidatus Binatia bacterium]|nr:hypothetical protein [Candidatus Binatia bacterium]